jgi:hypothetical protein
MTTEEKNLRTIIRKSLSEMENVSESDILVRAGVNWNEVKPKFLETVNDLVSKIDDDKYSDAEDLIGKATNMLKMWKAKIRKGKEMVDRKANVETLDEEMDELMEIFGGSNLEDKFNKLQKIQTNIVDLIMSGYDKEKLKMKIISLIDNKA